MVSYQGTGTQWKGIFLSTQHSFIPSVALLAVGSLWPQHMHGKTLDTPKTCLSLHHQLCRNKCQSGVNLKSLISLVCHLASGHTINHKSTFSRVPHMQQIVLQIIKKFDAHGEDDGRNVYTTHKCQTKAACRPCTADFACLLASSSCQSKP